MQSEHQDLGAINNLLFTGVISNNKEMINKALRAGANINALNINDKTALLLAIEFHHDKLDLTTSLLTKGADFTIKNSKEKNPLQIAKEKSDELHNEMLKTIKMLSEHENDDIKNVAIGRINQINLNLDQIEKNAPLNRNIQHSKPSWQNRCMNKEGCIIS